MTATDSLKSLHTVLVDAEKGYETAIEDAQDAQVKAAFETFSALHARAHADVHALLVAQGESPDESGSFLSIVHKTVISVRSALAGLDRSSLPSFLDGEERIVQAYDKAISDAGSTGPAYEALTRDRQALVAAIADVRALAV
jgi:uncharacterized protein (TIGR02284 family)